MFPASNHTLPDSECTRPGFFPVLCLAWIHSCPELNLSICQPPAGRGFCQTEGTPSSLCADFPSSSVWTCWCSWVAHTQQEVGHQCLPHLPSFPISSSYSFKSPATLHHPSVILPVCHLLFTDLLYRSLHHPSPSSCLLLSMCRKH